MATNPYTNPPEASEQMVLVQWLRLHKIAFAPRAERGHAQGAVSQKAKGPGNAARSAGSSDFRSSPRLPGKCGGWP